MVVDVGVPITEDVVLARDIIIGHSIWRQDRADAKFLAIMVGWVSLANNIVVETGSLVNSENTANCTRDRTYCAADYGSNGTGISTPTAAPSCAP